MLRFVCCITNDAVQICSFPQMKAPWSNQQTCEHERIANEKHPAGFDIQRFETRVSMKGLQAATILEALLTTILF